MQKYSNQSINNQIQQNEQHRSPHKKNNSSLSLEKRSSPYKSSPLRSARENQVVEEPIEFA